MRNTINIKKTAFVVLFGAAAVLVAARPAEAGRGGSPQAIHSAIAANSIDAIQAELERAEYLVCAACTDIVQPLVDHDDYRVRKVAAWWLVRRGTGRRVFVDMLNRLGQPDSVKARNAADVLGEFGHASAIPALGAGLSNPIFSGEARAAMARALGAIGQPAAAAPLVAAFASSDPAVKAAAVTALRTVRGFRDGAAVVGLVRDGDEQVRAQSVVTIGMLRAQDAGVVDALVSAVASDPSPVVRKKAAWALGEVGAPASVAGATLQAAATSDTNPLVRSLARAAISKLTR